MMQIEDEIQKGIHSRSFNAVDPITGEPLPQAGGEEQMAAEGSGMEGMGQDPMEMGEIPTEPDIDAEAAAIDANYQKDTKKAEL